MAEEQNDSKVISRKNSGFPDWLDFEKLRSEGIDYLGKLSGKIWTDHNVHDPGITILEVLCYALMDLGYRTHLPVEDIFARDPQDKTVDDNFLTPSQILTVNPLTITDFRKLLIDIKGIKNAWLQVAIDLDANKFCKREEAPVPGHDTAGNIILINAPAVEDPCCIKYLNGLYHVYLDLEINVDKEYEGREADKKKYLKFLVEKVKDALMTHRNICEDFIDVKILCKWDIGVCAEIELEDNADPEKVYLEMVEKLRQFFSPSPQFYTLPQLLDADKTIDEIFAGRPYNIMESHGFVDTEEFEKLKLKKSIHVSDVYNALFEVIGIKKIQRLRLRNCKKNENSKADEWVIKIPEDHVPDFSVSCSGFEFNRRGISVSFDFRKYESILELNFEHNGKILYSTPSDKIDTEIPKGIYHKDLGNYYSIQNEFPRVYGIAEGGLAANAPTFRKAQALQLKGYLLFFDQLLANYLSQLKNMRSLFSLKAEATGECEKRHTYFSDTPGAVPDFQELVRFKIDGDSNSTPTGETGFLAFPVEKKYLQDLIDQQQLKNLQIDNLQYFRFSTATEKEMAIGQLQEDMLNEAVTFNYVTKNDECVYYYVFTSSDDFALIGRKYYRDEKAAKIATESLKYGATIRSNYRSAILSGQNGFSFSVELNISSYSTFLQFLIEDESLYVQRRHSFLNHLMSRFAEKFTDHALLSYSFYTDGELQAKDSLAKERFLSNYTLLSSTRGKAFNYLANGWNTDNNSGFEKRIRAMMGHEELNRKSLCNFAVYTYDEKYMFRFKLDEKAFFKSDERFESRIDAQRAAGKLFDALAVRGNYHTEPLPYQSVYAIHINYDNNKRALFSTTYPSETFAREVTDRLHKMIVDPRSNGQVKTAGYKYSARLKDHNGQAIRTFFEMPHDEKEVKKTALKSLNKINDPDLWRPDARPEERIGKLLRNPANKANMDFVDFDEFKSDIDNTTVGRPDKFNYEFLDRNHRFKFISISEYDNVKKAREACYYAISLLADLNNLIVDEDKAGGKWSLFIHGVVNEAVCSLSFNARLEAESFMEQIKDIVKKYVYSLSIDSVPDIWNFNYNLGYEYGEIYSIESVQIYSKEEDAYSALILFSNSLTEANVEKINNEWIIKAEKEKKKIILGRFTNIPDLGNEEEKTWIGSATRLLEIQKQINRLSASRNQEEAFAAYVDVHEDSKCRHVYHLVDKDAQYAVYTKVSNTKADAAIDRKDAIKKNKDEYNFLELFMRGEMIINERKGTDGKTKWHHYLIRSSNYINNPLGGPAEKLVLFESTKGYTSKEDAEKAFTENYLEILTYGLDEKNYGAGKPISDTPQLIHVEDACLTGESTVYIPEATLKYLGTYPQQAIDELVKIVKSYPVRSIKRKEDYRDFYKRFLFCETPDCEEALPDCDAKKENPLYYFALYNKTKDQEDWQSVRYYDTAESAMTAFRFFLLLLRYEGNYFIDCDCTGKFKIFIREVLAESVDRFETEELAWGNDGIQKFILVSQTKDSFHSYVNTDCCHKFFVACKNIRLVHPCKYDTPEIRDKVIKELQRALPNILKWNFNDFYKKWENLLIDFEGKPVAHIRLEEQNMSWFSRNYIEGYIDIINYIERFALCIDNDKNEVYLVINDKSKLYFEMVNGSDLSSPKELKEKLLWLSCYFPFVKKEGEQSNNQPRAGGYCIEIRLPGFNACNDCDGESSPNELCAIAWTNECCFASCGELINGYNTIILWLQNFDLYRPVFDCRCGPYGIELYEALVNCIDANQNPNHTRADNVRGSLMAPGRIIATNPQCFTSAEMVCDAADRAKKLINSEGLHLVEHILLRPHCPEDCECLLTPCLDPLNPFDHCKFPYWDKKDDEDPCDETEPVCFQPGHDPYSFIATVILPAWPERFRRKENRAIIENMLHREAPAHVALRILWLTPHDLCCFERHFKRWLIWIAYKKSCIDDYKTCDLVNFMFNREFECWEDCPPCDTCSNDTSDEETCVDQIKQEEKDKIPLEKCREQTWLEQISKLYCWKNFNCKDYKYVDCENTSLQVISDDKNETIVSTEIASTKKKIKTAPSPLSAPLEIIIDKISKLKFVNSRLAAYRKHVDDIVSASKGNELAVKARRFLDTGTPAPEEFNKLAVHLLEALKNSESRKKTITRKQVNELIQNITSFFLDKAIFNGMNKELYKCSETFDAMRKSKLNMVVFYQDWGTRSLKKYQPELNLRELKKLITG